MNSQVFQPHIQSNSLLMDGFRSSFEEFLHSENIDYSLSPEGLYLFSDRPLRIRLVNVDGPYPTEPLPGTIFLYEDRWMRVGENVRKRILAHLGRFRSIFARNCRVKKLDTPQANEFLSRYHAYGAARSKYRYGLFCKDELVAVASFSAGRPMLRECGTVESFEWVRYASLPDVRISGGMGKLLQAFVDDIHPDEVMSYADLEWSDGSVYRTLGFKEASRRSAVDFYVDTTTWERISVSKLSSDRKFRGSNPDTTTLIRLPNLGSLKYLKLYI